ncbi:MAG: carbohydrate binding family 9 domain-containing protein, partial [Bacteroidota bacterium]
MIHPVEITTRLTFPVLLTTLFFLGLNQPLNLHAQKNPRPKRSYQAAKAQGEILLDGYFEEPAWQAANWSGHFTQKGQKISEQTDSRFKIVYDKQYLYVAIYCQDDQPESIPWLPSPRDNPSNDWVEVDFDSNLDRNSGYAFAVSPYGVRTDMLISGDDEDFDDRWHPTWQVKTALRSDGWSAEMQIPFDQLEIGDTPSWGLQVTRRIRRGEQYSNWQPMPAGTAGWVSQFGTLSGLLGIKGKPSSQPEQYQPDRTFKAAQLRQDLALLRATLEGIYPDLYGFTPKPTLDSMFDDTFAALKDGLTEVEFYRRITPLMNAIGDGHSWMRPSTHWVQYLFTNYKLLPLGVKIVEDSIYITKNFGLSSEISRGMSILAINGLGADEILSRARSFITA